MKRSLELCAKRIMDVVVAAIGSLVLLPCFLLIALAIKADSPGSIFFLQERVGLRGRRFQILKFRTMRERTEQMDSFYVGWNDSRITRVGKFLRRFSLDELPQLFQVVAGQMSLVGPRPALPYQLRYYSERDFKRLLVRPGLTGCSQVCGRNSLSWPERLEKDVAYVENFSLVLDCQILMRTPAVLLSGKGLYGPPENFSFAGQAEMRQKEQSWMS